jgi:hypothetical protein
MNYAMQFIGGATLAVPSQPFNDIDIDTETHAWQRMTGWQW